MIFITVCSRCREKLEIKYGLGKEGDEQFDFSTIFFRHRQWKRVWVEVNFPQNPFTKPKILEKVQ